MAKGNDVMTWGKILIGTTGALLICLLFTGFLGITIVPFVHETEFEKQVWTKRRALQQLDLDQRLTKAKLEAAKVSRELEELESE